FHGLNGGTGLSLRWNRDPNHRLDPDRFFGPLGPEMMMEDDFRRIMAVNRVSLFSFHRGENYFSKNVAIGPYAPSACRLLASSATIDSYLCPGMGGVGYFPNAVAVGKDQEQILGLLKILPFSVLENGFTILGPEGIPKPAADGALMPPFTAARGRVKSVQRGVDRIEYRLAVEAAGIFVVADTWFPGWSAQVNAEDATLIRANWGFKAVQVPVGEDVRVAMEFRVLGSH
ncbi:MAG: hypothetical protein AAB425_13615, partial [Bdellovibrionota bacterium]